MQLSDAMLLIFIGFIIFLFWQGRRQAEQARRYAAAYCKNHQLQLLDIAWQAGRPARFERHWGWRSSYQFAFSSDGESRYEGELVMLNLRLLEVNTPAYRLPD
ncbi:MULTISPECIES: DUF3301 domain-containing protein [Idiomarinaceae]|uniref:Uncharacterized protein DUF3301 n=4 Tax=Pseudidiomarina TaxID=2800384 RepID=A0A368V049_9GAMM|nr:MULTISPECIES: DUF3301 domain-containing protein [Idiomarinaceae]MDT7524781.1 DUF3301 domain-containing protein [Pseudidiomarina sp. GXY010]MDX1525235.1 DUF3301 domain-containing protein [Pseudidiomarina maritima]MRJ41473.1 DUF3301 domain-containing protein [Idiomarina sp. FeN1]NCU56948.1 DUF3301 domain-containing protein [Idiomarina sp. FenA--70]NCU59657.1 DUF3301 domain-containing protein [Idiomarina sp. FenBw--71]